MHRYTVGATLFLSALLGFVLLGNPRNGAYDFQAFYCAGSAVRMHADPYRSQPLGTCEHRQTDGTYAALPPGVVLPAPLPGYDIAALSLLSRLPFDRAKAVWGALLALGIALAVITTMRASGAAAGTVIMAYAASLIFPALAFGELFGFFAAAACAALYFTSVGRWNAAGIAAAASLVEPHLGFPLCVSLAVWKPRARLPLAGGLAVLAAIAFAVLGSSQNGEYVRTVLPLHAVAEITSDAQLSLSAVLHAIGIDDRSAILAGTLSYVAAALAGVVCAGVLSRHSGGASFVVAVPAAFATIGGTFIHVTELFAAIPLALLLIERRARPRWVFVAALALLSIPWYMALERGEAAAFAGLGAVVVLYLLWRYARKHLAVGLAFAAATFVLLYFAPAYASAGASVPRRPRVIADTSYPQASWQAFVYRNLSSASTASWMLRGLSWSGLVLLGAGTALIARDPHRLLVDELAQAQVGELSAVSAALDAAKR